MKTHRLNVSYLVVGLVFVGLAGSWALREAGVIDFGEVQWILPLTLVIAGAIGLIAVAAKGLRRRQTPEPGPTYDDTIPNPPDYTSDIEEKLK